jgi:hypothetical protein
MRNSIVCLPEDYPNSLFRFDKLIDKKLNFFCPDYQALHQFFVCLLHIQISLQGIHF